jgi:hypothetical protein
MSGVQDSCSFGNPFNIRADTGVLRLRHVATGQAEELRVLSLSGRPQPGVREEHFKLCQ